MKKHELSFEELFELKDAPIPNIPIAINKKVFVSLDERLELCRQCDHRTFKNESGLLCSLTKRKPDFEFQCENFQIDENLRLKSITTQSKRYTGFWVSRKPAIIFSLLALFKSLVRAYSNELDYLGIFFLTVGIVWILVVGSKKEE